MILIIQTNKQTNKQTKTQAYLNSNVEKVNQRMNEVQENNITVKQQLQKIYEDAIKQLETITHG